MARHKLYENQELKSKSIKVYDFQLERLNALKKDKGITWAQLMQLLLDSYDDKEK